MLAKHGVLIFRGQASNDAAFTEFLATLGTMSFTRGEKPVAGHPGLNVISNVGRDSPPRSSFHTDTSYVSRPPAYTALRAVKVPESGGETLFSDQYRAYETLPAAMQADLAARTVRHVITGIDTTALGPDDETAAAHPMLLRHPISGRTALYLTTPARCAAVSGLADSDAADLIAHLHAHSTSDDNVYRHAWKSGDIVVWDNRCVMHRADHSRVIGDRVMHRGVVTG
jgi:taurine dioxygenase